MKQNNLKTSTHLFHQFGKDIASVIGGTVMSFFLVQIISLIIIEKEISVLFNRKLILHIFSNQMIPPFIAFTVMIAYIYFLYQKTKHTMVLLHDQEIQREREKAVIQTSQTITSMMINYISRYNAEIKNWIEKRRKKGEQPPAVLAESSEKIGLALQTMSELSYVIPYGNSEAIGMKQYAGYLEEKLEQISRRDAPAIGN